MSDNPTIRQLLTEAWNKRREEKYLEARDLVKQAQALCKEDDFGELGRIYHLRMQFDADHNRLREASEWCLKSMDQYKKAGDQDKIAHATRHLADLQRRLGQVADSETNYREAIRLYRSNPHTARGNLANALRGFGLLLEKRDKCEEAIAVWKETLELYHACQLPAGVEEARRRLDQLL